MFDATLLRAQTAPALPKLQPGPGTREARAIKAGQDFEAVFLSDAFKLMFQDVSADPLAGNNSANQSWRELLVDEYAKNMVERGGIGLAKQITRELLAVQEANVR